MLSIGIPLLQLISSSKNDFIRKEASTASSCANIQQLEYCVKQDKLFLTATELGLLYLADYKEI